MKELKPCPFCGSEDIRIMRLSQRRVYCVDCGAQIISPLTGEAGVNKAIEKWNRRANEQTEKA